MDTIRRVEHDRVQHTDIYMAKNMHKPSTATRHTSRLHEVWRLRLSRRVECGRVQAAWRHVRKRTCLYSCKLRQETRMVRCGETCGKMPNATRNAKTERTGRSAPEDAALVDVCHARLRLPGLERYAAVASIPFGLWRQRCTCPGIRQCPASACPVNRDADPLFRTHTTPAP